MSSSGRSLLPNTTEAMEIGRASCRESVEGETGAAEDGIRDYKVTGVQTCALPIYLQEAVAHRDGVDALLRVHLGINGHSAPLHGQRCREHRVALVELRDIDEQQRAVVIAQHYRSDGDRKSVV